MTLQINGIIFISNNFYVKSWIDLITNKIKICCIEL